MFFHNNIFAEGDAIILFIWNTLYVSFTFFKVSDEEVSIVTSQIMHYQRSEFWCFHNEITFGMCCSSVSYCEVAVIPDFSFTFVFREATAIDPALFYNFKAMKIADRSTTAVDDHNGILNGSQSLIRNLKVEANGILRSMIVFPKSLLDHSRVSLQRTLEQNNFSFLILVVQLMRQLAMVKTRDSLEERLCLGHLQM